MISLSVNLNKIALLRNSRGGHEPSIQWASEVCLDAGCQGITVHPRPDQRHIRPGDVRDLKKLLMERQGDPSARDARSGQARGSFDSRGSLRAEGRPGENKTLLELNVEGRPTDEFLGLLKEIRPHQATLVPDTPGALTSDHGWNLKASRRELAEVVPRLKGWGIRVSLFMDPEPGSLQPLVDMAVDRVELYTGPYAEAFGGAGQEKERQKLFATARKALGLGLEVNAGHDLTVENLGPLRDLPGLREVSIGHHLIGRALEIGLKQSVLDYRRALGHKVDERQVKR